MYQSIIDLWSTVQAPPAPKLHDVTLNPKTTALLLLDFVCQACNEKIRPRCVQSVPAARRLLDKTRAHGALVVYSFGNVTPGRSIADTLPEVAPLANEPYVQTGPNKFYKTDLENILKDRGITTVIVTGTTAYGAVMHTADEAVFRGYKVVAPVDAISAEDLYCEQYVIHHFTRGSRVADATTLTSVDMIKFG
jgi:nicotinamidase-related amidase